VSTFNFSEPRESRGFGALAVWKSAHPAKRRVVYRREDLEVWLESRIARNATDAGARLPKSLTGQPWG
jgi:hypothetical protein